MSTLSVSSIQNTASPVSNIVVNADGSVTIGLYRTTGVAPTPVQTGTLWYDVGGAGLVIWNGSAWVGVGGGGGTYTGTAPIAVTGTVISANLATAAQAAAGTSATVLMTPQFAVPKDASGMTGAGILPSGTTAQRPATPVSGMVRVNTDTNPQLEQYANGTWQPIGVITSNLTLNVATTGNDTTGLGTVAAPWATPHRAMEYLSQYAIKQGVAVTVSVADGTYTFTTPLNLNHPNGSQIFINGGTTTGARPTTSLTGGNAVGNTGATLAANDTLLNAYYNTKWQFNGCHGLVCTNGGNVTVNTVLIRGDGSSVWSGVICGLYNGSAVSQYQGGYITLGNTVAIHNFGANGVFVMGGGSVTVNGGGLTVTNINGNGISVIYGGAFNGASNCVSNNNNFNGVITAISGSILFLSGVSRYNSQNGIYTYFGGSINADGATASNNGGNGIATNWGGSINAYGATASNNTGSGVSVQYGGEMDVRTGVFSNNGQVGILTNAGGSINAGAATASNNGVNGIATVFGGSINAQNATALGNSSTNVLSNGDGYIYFVGGSAAGSLSPAANSIGNGKGYIQT